MKSKRNLIRQDNNAEEDDNQISQKAKRTSKKSKSTVNYSINERAASFVSIESEKSGGSDSSTDEDEVVQSDRKYAEDKFKY